MARKPTYKELEQRLNKLEDQVSVLREAKKDAKRAEEEKRAILDSLLEHVVHQDTDMNVLWANQAACNSVGMTREDLIGRRCYEVWPRRESPCEDCPVTKARDNGKPQTVEKMTPDGRWWYIQAYPVRDDSGDIVGMSEFTLDITERKRAEDALRKSHDELEMRVEERTAKLSMANAQLRLEMDERIRAEEALKIITDEQAVLLSSVSAMIFWINKEGDFIRVNEPFAAALQKSPDEISGKSLFDLYPEDQARKYHDDNLEVIESGNPSKNIDEPVQTPAGTMWVSTDKIPYRDKEGNNAGIIGFSVDITDRKRAEEALRAREAALRIRTNELEEANTALKVLLKRRDEDKTEVEQKVLLNINELVVPYAEKLKKTSLDKQQIAYLNVLESNLNNIISPFTYKLSSKALNLTPKEIHVANLVRDGKTSKEIAQLFNVSVRAIEFHRKRIRAKIGLKNSKINLRSHLFSM